MNKISDDFANLAMKNEWKYVWFIGTFHLFYHFIIFSANFPIPRHLSKCVLYGESCRIKRKMRKAHPSRTDKLNHNVYISKSYNREQIQTKS